ncbi:unnamed protein product [Effrenium voratum]|nr:unnamed protein product [Effrenium voratum]
MGGFIGSVLLGVLADPEECGDAPSAPSSCVNPGVLVGTVTASWEQLGKQLAAALLCATYSFLTTLLLLKALNLVMFLTPGHDNLDVEEHGKTAYDTPAKQHIQSHSSDHMKVVPCALYAANALRITRLVELAEDFGTSTSSLVKGLAKMAGVAAKMLTRSHAASPSRSHPSPSRWRAPWRTARRCACHSAPSRSRRRRLRRRRRRRRRPRRRRRTGRVFGAKQSRRPSCPRLTGSCRCQTRASAGARCSARRGTR